MSELIISVSGLRGIVGETLTPEVAMRYAVAFAATLPKGAMVITRDSRPSGGMLADAIHSALNAAGRETVDAGIAATPTTGILIRRFGAIGGVQISASHNPVEFNGMKLFSAEGRVISKGSGAEVLKRYHEGATSWVRNDELGQRSSFTGTSFEHLRAITETVDRDAIARRKFRVLLDSNHGAGALLAAWLFEELNCEATILGEKPDGRFLHAPEPTPENLLGVCEQVRQLEVDIAFCQDPDADRVAVIDGHGRYLGEEYTLALCLDHVLRSGKRRKGPVVINCATSRINEDIANKHGVPIFRSAVGEANVVDLMLEKDAIFGGEGNGGPIDPQVGLVRDSFVGIAQILDAMASTAKSVAELADALPRYELVKRKADVDGSKVPEMLDKTAAAFKHLPCDRLDGLRIDHGDAWVLLRGSNTEPIIRIFAEAPNRKRAEQLCDDIEKVLK